MGAKGRLHILNPNPGSALFCGQERQTDELKQEARVMSVVALRQKANLLLGQNLASIRQSQIHGAAG